MLRGIWKESCSDLGDNILNDRTSYGQIVCEDEGFIVCSGYPSDLQSATWNDCDYTQFAPADQVTPGNAGFPIGLPGQGW